MKMPFLNRTKYISSNIQPSAYHGVALNLDVDPFKQKQEILFDSPTPRVSWTREEGGPMPRGRWRMESFGQELVIEDLRYEDEGVYECQGINEVWNTPIRRSITLTIECEFYGHQTFHF